MLDFRINTFLTVCKHMNFTKAAQELNITQPAVSQHIRHLEDVYNVKLFDYKNKKVILTEAGKLLRDSATTMFHDQIHLENRLRELQGKKRTINFGVTLTIGEFVILKPVAEYLKEQPQVSIKIMVANTHELINKLNEGELDFALVEGFFAKNEYDSLVYSREDYIAVCGKDYKPQKPLNRIEDTFGERLIVREAGSGTREIFEKYLESRNFQIDDYSNIVEISNINAIKSLVMQGCGITFLYKAAVSEELEQGTLKIINLKDFNVDHDFTFIWRRDSVFSDYYKDFFRILRG